MLRRHASQASTCCSSGTSSSVSAVPPTYSAICSVVRHATDRCYDTRVDGERLGAAFLAHLPAQLREGVRPPGDALAALLARARSEAPGVDLDALAFVAYVAERVTFDRHGQPVLAPLHAGALWIAFGCVGGDAAAVAAFEATYGGEMTSALTRSFERGLAED